MWTNDVAYSYGACQAPWGGRKESGFGRTHSRQGLRELSHLKFTDADSGRVSPPWWFPYDERTADGFRGAVGRALRRGPVASCHRFGVTGAVWSTLRRRYAVADERALHVTRPATSAWSTSAASRSRAAGRLRARPCGWRPRRRGGLRELPKGDALATAQLAGIMAAKRTSELIPLCHPLPLSHVDVELEVGDASVEIVATAETTAQTGVEMEALVAASVAALTVYDMAKAIDKGDGRRDGVRLVEKTKESREGGGADGLRTASPRGRARTRAATCSRSCSPARASRSCAGSCPTSATRSPRRSPSSPSESASSSRPAARACAARRHARGDARVLERGRRGSPRRSAPTRSRRRRTRCSRAALAGVRGDDARRQPARLAGRLPRRLRGAAPGARARARAARRRAGAGAPPDVQRSLASLPRRFARLVKIEHTVFALPFAYVGAFLAVDGVPSAHDLLWITLAMVGARSLAMGLNRLIDAQLDARNPRTAARELPAGKLTPAQVVVFCLASLALFLVAVWQLDPLVRWLWPIPVVGFVVYPYLKRFTWLCHLWLGAVDGLAPVGAWVAITGRAAVGGVGARRRGRALGRRLRPLLLALRRRGRPRAGLHSWATRFGERGAFWGARLSHAATVACLVAAGLGLPVGALYWLGSWVVAASCSPTSTRSCGRATCAGSTRRSSR